MPPTAPLTWTIEAFFAWQQRQTDRYELVGGFPVRMTAGAKNIHDDIVVNLIAELRRQLRGGPCRPFTGDGAVQTGPAQVRRPDAGIDCGRRDPDALLAAKPVAVMEVLSPSTRDFDTFDKLAEYRDVESLDYILVIEPNAPEVVLWSRAPDRVWVRATAQGLDAEAAMPGIGVSLALAEVYDGVRFPTGPRLARVEG